MPPLARADVLAYLLADDEIPGAIQWATSHQLEHSWDEDALEFSVYLESRPEPEPDDPAPASESQLHPEPYLLRGHFPDYRALPPIWRFFDPRDGSDIGRSAYPQAGPFQDGSVLHGQAVICAPWNRLAYAMHSGPHSDWTDPASWQTVASDKTHALTIPEMLARVRAEVIISPARLAPLPNRESTT